MAGTTTPTALCVLLLLCAATGALAAAWKGARSDPACRNAMMHTHNGDEGDETSWEYDYGDGWAWTGAYASFWADDEDVGPFHVVLLQNTTSNEVVLKVLAKQREYYYDETPFLWMDVETNITVTPEGEEYSVKPSVVVSGIDNQYLVVCGASSKEASSSVCSQWDVVSREYISSITFEGANISTAAIARSYVQVLVALKRYHLRVDSDGLLLERVSNIAPLGVMPLLWGDTVTADDDDELFTSAYYEDVGWVGHTLTSGSLGGKMALQTRNSFAMDGSSWVMVATRFLQGCVGIARISSGEISGSVCSTIPIGNVTHVIGYYTWDVVIMFTDEFVVAMHDHSGSHYEWIRPRDPPEFSVPVNPCMMSVESRDTVVFLSGSRLQGLDARSGLPNWRYSLSSGINPIEMWGGDGAVMVASEEGGRIKLYSISTRT